MKRFWMICFALFLFACGGSTGIDAAASSGAGGGGGAGGAFDAYPCPISATLICDECTSQPAGSVCGIWGVCAAAGPFCIQPCDHLANNSTCAPGRHCQAVEAGNPLAVCYPGEGEPQ